MSGINRLPQLLSGERRSRQRFSVRLPIAFITETERGTGEVLDISHDGIAFTGRVPRGEQFTAVVALPVQREAGPVELVLECEAVREDAGCTGASIRARRFQAANHDLACAARSTK